MNICRTIGVALAMDTLAKAAPAWAAAHQVKMCNKDAEGRVMQFEPSFIKIAPGDTVTFLSTDKGHNSETLPGLLPEGAKEWKGKINEEITVTYDVAGFYGVRCAPHFGMGMVGLIQVGDSATPPDISGVKLPGKAKTRMTELVEQAATQAN